MAWYDTAVFYHIYPLGLCGCAHENDGQPTPGAFAKLNAWAEHASKDLGCTAIYIGPLFESGSHGYDTIDYRRVDRRLGTNEEFREFVANCHARGQKVIVDGVFNHVGRDFFAFKDLQANRENARYLGQQRVQRRFFLWQLGRLQPAGQAEPAQPRGAELPL